MMDGRKAASACSKVADAMLTPNVTAEAYNAELMAAASALRI